MAKKKRKRGPGRPRSENPRSIGILLRLNKGESAIIDRKAKRGGKNRAEWIRDIILAA